MTESGDAAALPGKEARTWAMLCHLLALSGVCVPFGHVLGPLIIWMLKREEDPFIDDQGKEALNFQLTMTIAIVAAIVLSFLTFFIAGIVLFPVLILFEIVVVIIASVAANEGRTYRYPVAIRFIK